MNKGNHPRLALRWLGCLAAAAMLSVLAPSTAVGTEADAATTTAVSAIQATGEQYGGFMSLVATVTSEGSPQPDGFVVFSLDGVEHGRARLVAGPTESSAELESDWPVGSSMTVTAEFTGSPGFLPSQDSETSTGPASYTGFPATGSIGFGDVQAPIQPEVPFFQNHLGSSPVTGAVRNQTNQTPHKFEADIAGVGPVAISARPSGALTATVESDGTVSGFYAVTWQVFRIAVGGTSWAGACPARFSTNYEMSGQSTGDHLLISGVATPETGFASTDCDGRGDLVNALFSEPSTIALNIQGNFPAPPAPNTATTTTIDVTPNLVDGQTTLEVLATVTSESTAAPNGSVTITTSGGYSRRVTVAPTGTPLESAATRTFYGPFPEGPVQVSASYSSYSEGAPFLASAGSLNVERAPAKTGIPVSGEFTMGSNTTMVFPVGSVLEGGAFDPATGVISGAQLSTPRANVPINFGFSVITAITEISQDAPANGLVAQDGTATLGPLTLAINSPAFRQTPSAPGAALEPCTKTVTVTLTGTADENGLDLSASDMPLPSYAPDSCDGLSSFIDTVLGSTFGLSLKADGDYRLGIERTQVSLTSWFPQVSEGNHALLSAEVSSPTAATGEVTFFDGTTELGSATVGSNGTARLAAPLNHIGIRSIVARYSGDETHQSNQASTNIDVAPTPDGLAINGTLQVGQLSIPIGTDSVLEPQSTSAGARLWLAPATVDISVPGYGNVSAEVRLVQQGRLSTVSIEPDGHFEGLSGWFMLHVRKVTMGDGTSVTPIGCASNVLLALKGQVRPVASPVDTEAGGSGAYGNHNCTGAARAVTDSLTGQPVELSAIVSS